MNKINTPTYSNFPFISNDNVSLRQILISNIKDLIEISLYDSIQATPLEQAVKINSKFNADYDKDDSVHWGFANNHSDKIVGNCGYYRGFN